MKEKAILLLWLHIAQRNDSLIGEYISTFSEDVFSPYLQFGDDEVDILKNINEDYALLLNSKRNQIKVKLNFKLILKKKFRLILMNSLEKCILI